LGGDGPNVVDRGFEGRVVPELAFVAVRSWFVGDLIVPRQVSPGFLHWLPKGRTKSVSLLLLKSNTPAAEPRQSNALHRSGLR